MANRDDLYNSRKRSYTENSSLSSRNIRRITLDQTPLPPSANEKIFEVAADSSEDIVHVKQQIDEDTDDDDSIEVLLTILPPSPKKKKSKTSAVNACRPGDQGEEMENLMPSMNSASVDSNRVKSATKTPLNSQTTETYSNASGDATDDSVSKGSIANQEVMEPTVPTNAEESKATRITREFFHISPKQSYPYLTSAYLQNLAEICYTILEDRRYRVSTNVSGRCMSGTINTNCLPNQWKRERLLQWQFGDDLSAVIPLARRFQPLPSPRKDDNGNNDAQEGSLDNQPLQAVYSDRQEAKLAECSNDSSREIRDNSTVDQDDEETLRKKDAANDRCLHLYCRMFYLKGPWFRIDDIYCRYYAPKQKIKQDSSSETESSSTDNPETGGTEKAQQNKRSPVATGHNRTFFHKRHSADKQPIKPSKFGNKTDSSSIINHDIFEKHLAALSTFLKDVVRLKEMGLIRTFHDEEECGKTVGTARVLLTNEERGQVLSKLGCRKNGTASIKRRRPSSTVATPATNSSGRDSSISFPENEIWKQMCSQKSILTVAGSCGKRKAVLLPVSRHVNQVLLDRLAARIVRACSSTDYVGASIMRPYIAFIMSTISKLIGSPTSTLAKFGTCIRLREAPLRSLQRCVRLYLCASGGPGEMRSDGGTNGWKSIRELDRHEIFNNTQLKDAKYASNVEPPGAHSWHLVLYPGLQMRFGLSSYSFQDSFKLLLASDDSADSSEEIFSSQEAFTCWEAVAELRANADYLIEVNELLLYNERKRARDDQTANSGSSVVQACCPSAKVSSMDILGLCSPDERKEMIDTFLYIESDKLTGMKQGILQTQASTRTQIECEITSLLSEARDGSDAILKTESEVILCVMGLIIKNILSFRTKSISERETAASVTRPWLRHLSWEACIAYILWDIIPILERRGFYLHVIQSLELLIFGSMSIDDGPIDQISSRITSRLQQSTASTNQCMALAFAHTLLSRRARGKALDRFVIDLTHLIRKKQNMNTSKTKKTSKKNQKRNPIQDFAVAFTTAALAHFVTNASIGFSSIRTLARRLKQPLQKSLEFLQSPEAKQLGLRLSCPSGPGGAPSSRKYSDWVPITDHAVANSMAIEEAGVGRRCSFVGHEDTPNGPVSTSSLNVEQLAMEFYNSGRLPAPSKDESDDDFIKGGWVGWHDEGGMVRALFRVMVYDVLGMDWSCRRLEDTEGNSLSENKTIHLSPYQGAPFDLHVGYELADTLNINGKTVHSNRGFFLRRQKLIQSFLAELEGLRPQEISDAVYEAIATRRTFMEEADRKDPFLERDLLQCRTLSMLAAGFGGKMLSAMFKCYFFDYRHYSGGLPDLLLVRANYMGSPSLVDLSDWVGETFDAKYLAELENQQRASLLGDRDDDFLGCSKVGDSGGAAGGNRNRALNRGRQATNSTGGRDSKKSFTPKLPQMPPKLQLSHNGSDVDVEVMFVEVKSHNDRLDARQEDWLNVLDRCGNARVCKFSDGKNLGRKSKPQKRSTN